MVLGTRCLSLMSKSSSISSASSFSRGGTRFFGPRAESHAQVRQARITQEMFTQVQMPWVVQGADQRPRDLKNEIATCAYSTWRRKLPGLLVALRQQTDQVAAEGKLVDFATKGTTARPSHSFSKRAPGSTQRLRPAPGGTRSYREVEIPWGENDYQINS